MIGAIAKRPELELALVQVSQALFGSGLVSAAFVTFSAVTMVAGRARLSPPAWSCLFAFYAMMYLVDRMKPAPEDAGAGDEHAAGFVRARKDAFAALLGAIVVVEATCAVKEPLLMAAVGASLAVSLAYVLPIPGLGRRIKEIPGLKPFYLGVTISTISGTFVWVDTRVPFSSLVAGAAVYGLIIVVNTALYDLKDLEADHRAGLRSLAHLLGAPGLLRFLHAVNLAAVALAWALLPSIGAWIATAFGVVHVASLRLAARRPFDAVMAAGIDGTSALVGIAGVLASVG